MPVIDFAVPGAPIRERIRFAPDPDILGGPMPDTVGYPVRTETARPTPATDRLLAEIAAGIYSDTTLQSAVGEGFNAVTNSLRYLWMKCSCCGCFRFVHYLLPAYSGQMYVCPACRHRFTYCDTCTSLILSEDNVMHFHSIDLIRLRRLNRVEPYNFDIMTTPNAGFRTSDSDRTPKYSTTRFFGIELEVERAAASPPDMILKATQSLADGFALTLHDGSLQPAQNGMRGSNGFEVVTLPATKTYHLRDALWNRFFAAIGPFALSRPASTGLHVHVNLESIGKAALGRLTEFVNSPANLPFLKDVADRDFTAPSPVTGRVYAPTFEPKERVKDLVRRRLHRPGCAMAPTSRVLRRHYMDTRNRIRRDPYGNPIIVNTIGQDKVTRCNCPEGQYDYPDHYSALNVRTNHPTVEFRLFQGSMNPVHFFAALDFCDAIINFCDAAAFSDLTTEKFLGWFKGHRSQYRRLAEWLVITGYIAAPKGKKNG